MKVISIATVRTPSKVEGEEPAVDIYEASATVPPVPNGQPAAFVTQSAIMNVLNSQLSGLAQSGIVPDEISVRIEE